MILSLLLFLVNSLPISAQTFFPELGLAITELGKRDLVADDIQVTWTRSHHMTSNKEIEAAIINNHCFESDTKRADARLIQSKIAADSIAAATELFNRKLSTLFYVTNSRSKRSAFSHIKSAFKSQFVQSLAANSISQSIPIIGSIYASWQDSKIRSAVDGLHKKVNALEAEFLSSRNHLIADLDSLRAETCALVTQTQISLSIDRSLQLIEQELISLSTGSFPSTAEFHAEVLKICSSLENSESFCHRVLFDQNYKFTFIGSEYDSERNLLAIKLDLRVPREQSSFKDSKLVQMVNLGNFENASFLRVKLPELALITSSNQIYSLKNDCSPSFCKFSDLDLADNRCLTNLLNGTIDDCEKEIFTGPKFCEIRKIKSGHLISINKENLITAIDGNPIFTEFNRTTILTHNHGSLTCQDDLGQSITLKLGTETKYVSDIEYPLKIVKTESLSARYSSLLLLTLNDSISELSLSDDKILIGRNHVSTLKTIISASLLTLALALISVYACKL
jgi:hypothetical protein